MDERKMDRKKIEIEEKEEAETTILDKATTNSSRIGPKITEEFADAEEYWGTKRVTKIFGSIGMGTKLFADNEPR
jgi:hypothetical protein